MKRGSFSIHSAVILTLLMLALAIDMSKFDLWLAGQFYEWQGQSWALRNAFLTETLLHKGLRQLLVLMVITLIVVAMASCWIKHCKHWQRPLWFLIVCFVSIPLLVAIGKSITHMDCPWDILQFGGQNPYLHLLQPHPGTWTYGRCFPGGHSSGGFSLIALYFVFAMIKPQWRYQGLAVGLCIGFICSFTQQLRGAHFLSHDLWSMAIAWGVCLTYQFLFFRKEAIAWGFVMKRRNKNGTSS